MNNTNKNKSKEIISKDLTIYFSSFISDRIDIEKVSEFINLIVDLEYLYVDIETYINLILFIQKIDNTFDNTKFINFVDKDTKSDVYYLIRKAQRGELHK